MEELKNFGLLYGTSELSICKFNESHDKNSILLSVLFIIEKFHCVTLVDYFHDTCI